MSREDIGADPRDLDRLVASALAGERGAMDTLLRILRPLVVRYCRSRLGGYERVNASPDDVAQEVCVAVLRALPTYQDQGRPFLAFVYGIAQHKVVDAHRAAGPGPLGPRRRAARERGRPRGARAARARPRRVHRDGRAAWPSCPRSSRRCCGCASSSGSPPRRPPRPWARPRVRSGSPSTGR